ncbi:MAG: SRPBCC family protein [Rubrivivax sp.]|nr:MAG: SRPBCC family protein [Rubrivivax sp.]
MTSHQVRIISQTIEVPIEAAYAFAHRPENFQKWAAGLANSLHKTANGWVADTPQGQATVRFSEPNAHGVLDHWVNMAGKPEVYIPLRMIANGSSTEVELVLFRQAEMSDADFERDEGLIKQDLATLKKLLEAGESK